MARRTHRAQSHFLRFSLLPVPSGFITMEAVWAGTVRASSRCDNNEACVSVVVS